MTNLIPKTLFTAINVVASALIIYLFEIDSYVINFIVCCFLVIFDGAVLDCAYETGKNDRPKRRWTV